ncbi:Clp protease N-terminal domain-containing protein [Amycolatopsis sp. NPDC049253]|uniref:Clp protease N-terminal domain-containing protein n=1 Tax=Amycolatopsis sp. NPDC049253 TaxID=3155274 RepID=UPI0034205968
MLERFSTGATQVVAIAQREADADHAESVDILHLLRGLLSVDACGRRILAAGGVTRESLTSRLPAAETRETDACSRGFSVQAKMVLKQAWLEAASEAGSMVGTDHITQAILKNEAARTTILSLSIDVDALDRALELMNPTEKDRELPQQYESVSRQPASKVDRELRYR